MLTSRGYKFRIINQAIEKAKTIPRERALERVVKSKSPSRRPVFSIEYHPALPPLSSILRKQWRVMIDDPHLKETFPLPPMVAYRRPKNLKETLIRAKVPPAYSRPKRKSQGMKRCPYDCNTCPYAQLGSKVKATNSNYIHEIVGHVDCQTDNLIYCVSCGKCGEQYVGETEKTLAVRFSQHRGYARNGKLNKAMGHHFNLPGHSLANMKSRQMTPR